MQSKRIAQISPLIQTLDGPCFLLNYQSQIVEDIDGYIEHENAPACEVVLRNPSLITSRLKFKHFIPNEIERVVSTGYSNLYKESFTEKV